MVELEVTTELIDLISIFRASDCASSSVLEVAAALKYKSEF
jgi:hypothetical protein